MDDVIKVYVIKDPEGNVWKTPKGKSSWSSVGAAKNAWNAHNWYKVVREICGVEYTSWVHKVWSKNAEPAGWKVCKAKEYKLVVEDGE